MEALFWITQIRKNEQSSTCNASRITNQKINHTHYEVLHFFFRRERYEKHMIWLDIEKAAQDSSFWEFCLSCPNQVLLMAVANALK